jgi:hypothetical protein
VQVQAPGITAAGRKTRVKGGLVFLVKDGAGLQVLRSIVVFLSLYRSNRRDRAEPQKNQGAAEKKWTKAEHGGAP